MKTRKTFFQLILLLSFALPAAAQHGPPPWAPAHGKHKQINYYYLPAIETYYDISSAQFVYYDGGTWIQVNALPRQYAGFNLYSATKVELEQPCGPPWTCHTQYKSRFPKNYKGPIIHTHHKTWKIKPVKGKKP